MSADADSFGFFFTSAGAVTATAIVLFCTVMSFFYSLMEYSAKFVGDLKHSSEEDETKREKAVKIRENSEKYQERARTGFLMNFALVMIFSSVGYIPFVKGLFSSAGDVCSGIVSFVAVILPMLIVSEIFGRFLPEKIAFLDAENILAKYSVFFMIISAFAVPMTFICSAVSGGIAKIFGHGSGADNKDKTEEKILMMVDEGEENGSIEENTKSMIENVFDFDDTTVGEIMTHRKDVVAVEDNAKITELTKTAIKSGCSRIPVYHGDIDNIVGIIYVKDLLKYVSTNAPSQTIGSDIVRKAVFVPESKRCSEMFEYMTKHKTQIAVVVDEFGGTGGIITMEDLIESILGNIQDEYDNEEEDIKKLAENSFKVDGATPLDEIGELTGIDFEDEKDDTIAGIMLDRLGYIPKNSEHPSIEIENTRFTVLEVENRRISKILVVKKKPVNEEVHA